MSSAVNVHQARLPRVGLILTAHLLLAGAFVAVVAAYLGRMVSAGVGPAEMLTGQYDPKDMVPFGMSGANPFFWLYGAVSLLYLFGIVLGPVIALYTGTVLARERHRYPVRARRLLLAAMVGTLVLTVLRFTPALDSMHQWWLD
ncbi:hypothetical protein E1193_13060 [Micromonospora sp. KC606]|uniref:hypothetical protein n=1 Tax=Micromonospora sp. KC606 TaxID=2530379 RepID=UPI00104CCEC3|nr:hypothetical protein [Micromonospora sp. KC606]TDC82046.1 hypothetical protein E1193_13060 [Micromonospora sp. KC606]